MLKTANDLVVAAKATITEISPEQARGLLGSSTLLIDVREPHEYQAGHLPGAVNLPRGMLEFMLPNQPGCQSADVPLMLYCKTSGRAALAAQSLQSLGYTDVKSMAGGFDAWAAAGLPVNKPGETSFD